MAHGLEGHKVLTVLSIRIFTLAQNLCFNQIEDVPKIRILNQVSRTFQRQCVYMNIKTFAVFFL